VEKIRAHDGGDRDAGACDSQRMRPGPELENPAISVPTKMIAGPK
jgi:hypothetical protein